MNRLTNGTLASGAWRIFHREKCKVQQARGQVRAYWGRGVPCSPWLRPRALVTRWTPLAAVSYCTWLYLKGINEDLTNVEVQCYSRLLPLRTFSKFWGKVAGTELPESVRPFVYGKYSEWFGVNLEEAASPDLTSYSSLCEFFARPLKPGSRPLEAAPLVAPCDGRVLSCGEARGGRVEQVKGVSYSLRDFFGENTWDESEPGDEYLMRDRSVFSAVRAESPDELYCKSVLRNPDNVLHQCVIYLAPGDYHRFHSPCDWSARLRRHFSGKLLSVNPVFAKLIPGLFCLNERATYLGRWRHGFFSFTAVGATNVGSIRVYRDEDLHTNGRRMRECKERRMRPEMQLERGEILGQFDMGSTIVLVFEAPRDFQFHLSEGQRVRMGQQLGGVGGEHPGSRS